ncbi:araC family transcriptional regulator [Bordetella ansorpii]|uniref:AraC family transcriptional regulator n=1 Tax=Bordetella ansorpii TaxID=288768 RepID=A0A157NRL0_9BORD|nr:AraC family transcriptional regulator [Bordetella ansorpii]SAI23754.1 araC family transcriptional regulator [Bordetella ansorpii]
MPQSALKNAIARYLDARHPGEDGAFATAIDGLVLMRNTRTDMLNHMIYRPAMCLVAQGAKCVMLNDQVLHYAEMQSLVISVELPGVGRITQASPDRPYLAIALEFDPLILREVLAQLPSQPAPAEPGLGLYVEDTDAALADCMLRLVNVLETPAMLAVLAPLLMREICARLLTGPNGGRLCTLALPAGHAQRVGEAIRLLRTEFTRALRIEELAAAANMSTSSFHQHFKQLTSMTPLQYQKQLRLLEARRLMLVEDANVMRAAYRVGYESPSQFSREYTRMFGVPPKRDTTATRHLGAAATADYRAAV